MSAWIACLDAPGSVYRRIGLGVEEIRVSDPTGACRVVYFARRTEAVYVLHAFQKKTQQTSQRDLDIARKRFAQLGGRT